jgi:MscS family membrane protein
MLQLSQFFLTMNSDWLTRTFLGNTTEQFLWFFGVLLAGIAFRTLIAYLFSQVLFEVLKKHSKEIGSQKLVELLKRPFGFFVIVSTLYFAFSFLSFPVEWQIGPSHHFGIRMFLQRMFQIFLIISFTWIVLRIIDFIGLILQQKASKTDSRMDDQIVPFVKEGLKISITIISLFFILGAVFKLNITSLIAGLGIGGLAVALAAKESLENLLGSFTIFFDKPFVIGDFVEVDGVKGHVEKIGFRSTRIRTVEKSFLTVPNKKMVDSILDNITLKTMQRIRMVFSISWDTEPQKIEHLILKIGDFLEEQTDISKDYTVKFFEINNNGGFEILVVYFVNTPSYEVSLDVKQKVNFKVLEILKEEEIGLMLNNFFSSTNGDKK